MRQQGNEQKENKKKRQTFHCGVRRHRRRQRQRRRRRRRRYFEPHDTRNTTGGKTWKLILISLSSFALKSTSKKNESIQILLFTLNLETNEDWGGRRRKVAITCFELFSASERGWGCPQETRNFWEKFSSRKPINVTQQSDHKTWKFSNIWVGHDEVVEQQREAARAN